MKRRDQLFLFLQKSIICILIMSLSSGCSWKAWTVWPTLGVRPNEPNGSFSENVTNRCLYLGGEDKKDKANQYACLQYHEYREWGLDLAAAYRSRATLNEWGLTAAALIALAGAGAITGLAAFGATASDAYKIIPLAGGFIAGSAAWFDNKKRAKDYTEAANSIMNAVGTSEGTVTSPPTASSFSSASKALYDAIVKVQNDLENKRNEQLGTADVQELTSLLKNQTKALEDLKTSNDNLKKETEELKQQVKQAAESGTEPATSPTQ